MNKHERRAYNAGVKAAELATPTQVTSKTYVRDANPFLYMGLLRSAWQDGWNSIVGGPVR